MVTREKLLKIFQDLANKEKNDIYVKNILSILEKHKLMSLMPPVLKMLEQETKSENLKNNLVISVARKSDVDNLLKDKIKGIFGGSDMEVKIVEDKNINVGFLAEYRNMVYDARGNTRAHRLLKTLKESFIYEN